MVAEITEVIINSRYFGHVCISGNTPSFNTGIFALLQWELSWGAKSLLTASAESAGNTFNYSLQQNY
jgi:hypothetical protein